MTMKWGAAICVLVGLVLGCGKGSEEKGAPTTTATGCTKDSDCKGDRICVSGVCADAKKEPAAQAPAAPTVPAPAGAPPSSATAHIPPANCGVERGDRFGFLNPPPGKEHAIARADARFDAAEVGRLPWGTEVKVLEPQPVNGWFKIWCFPEFGKKEAWIHKDVLKLGEHAPAQRP